VLLLAIKTKHRTVNDTSSHGNLCIAPTTLLTTDHEIILHILITQWQLTHMRKPVKNVA